MLASRRRRPLTPLVVVSLAIVALVAGCSSAPDLSGRPTGADEAVIYVSRFKAGDPTETRLAALPVGALFGDGRVIRPAAQAAVEPGPALPALQVTTLDSAGVDAILASYVMLEKKAGWEFTRELLASPKNDFLLRYAALRAVRFFVDYRADVVSKKEAVAAVVPLLDQSDIADLAIEDLRKWQQWHLAERILALQKKKSHWEIPILRRTVLRYALCCPGPETARFVEQVRKRDPELVQDMQELLRLENGTAPNPPPADS